MSVETARANLAAAAANLEAGELGLAELRYRQAAREWRYMSLNDPYEVAALTLEIVWLRESLRSAGVIPG